MYLHLVRCISAPYPNRVDSDDLVFLGQQFVRLGRMATHESRPEFKAAESLVVGELLDRRFSTITELAASTGYAQSRISKAVATLREIGMVGTRSDPSDGRRSVVYLVDASAGQARREAAVDADEVLAEAAPDFSLERRAELLSLLDELAVALRTKRPTGQASESVLRKWSRELGVASSELDRMSPRQLLGLVEQHRVEGLERGEDDLGVSETPTATRSSS